MTAAPPIRVLIAKPGLDGHDVGAKLVCRALMDAGMEVLYTGLRQSPEDIARVARDEDVDVVGLSILSGAHLSLTRRVKQALLAQRVEEAVLVVGGNVPEADRERLLEAGADLALPTGTTLDEVVAAVRREVRR